MERLGKPGRASLLKKPGDYTPFTCPEGDGPYRIRWTYLSREIDAYGDYIEKRDEVRSRPGELATDCWHRAKAKVAEMEARERATTDGTMPLRELLDRYLASNINIARRTRTDYEGRIKRIALRLGDRMATPIGLLDGDDLQRAFSPANGCKGSRKDEQSVGYLRWALDYARDTRKLSGPNPAARLEAPKYRKQTKEPMTQDALTLILQWDWSAEQRLYFVLSIYSAWRPSEVLGLHWSDRKVWGDFRNEQGRKVFPGSQVPMLHCQRKASTLGIADDMQMKAEWERETGRGLTLTPFIVELMDAARAEQKARGYTGDLMFPPPKGGDKYAYHRPNRHCERFYNKWMLEVGLGQWVDEKPRKGNKAPRTIEADYTPHELRHSGITIREELELSVYMQLEVGHKLPGVHAEYVNLRPEKRLEQSLRVSNYVQKIVMEGQNPNLAVA